MTTVTPHGSLVSSEDVEGTAVYSTQSREKIGTIHHLVIDKVSGKVAYADMSFGGFLGLGEGHHSVPWQALKYDTELEGFVTGITEDQLQEAPAYRGAEDNGRLWEEDLHRHYGLSPYWAVGL